MSAQKGKPGSDLVRRGACRGGHGHVNLPRPTSPPLDLCTYASGRYKTIALFMCFFHPICVLGGVLPRGLWHNLLMQFSSLGCPSPLFEVPCRRR